MSDQTTIDASLTDKVETKCVETVKAGRMFRSLHKKDTDEVVEEEKQVTAWLKELRLERYAKAFVEAGYQDLSYIAEMSLDDAMEIEGMKKPHAKRICKASRNLTT